MREVSQARERERKEDKTHRSFLPATRVSTHLPFTLRVHGLRRWDRDVPMGKGWDHQCSQVSIVDVVMMMMFIGTETLVTQLVHEISRMQAC